MSTRVTQKGQVTIPKSMRDRFGIVPGTSIDFADHDGELVVVLKAVQEPSGRFDIQHPVAGWNGMTTDELMALTRGDDAP